MQQQHQFTGPPAWSHSYGKQVLSFYNYKLYAGSTQVMHDIEPTTKYKHKQLRTTLVVGNNIAEEPTDRAYKKIGLYRLNHECKLAVVSKPIGNLAWRKGQRVYYYITHRRPGMTELSVNTFRNHLIEHDAFNKRVRGVGECFADKGGKTGREKTAWVYYDQPRGKNPIHIYHGGEKELINEIKNQWAGKEEETETVLTIPEIPVLITDDNYLLCIPKTKAPQKILLVGETRYGKSFFLNAMLGRIRYIWHDAVIMLNDLLGQFSEMGVPNKNNSQIRVLRRFGHEPMPLPVIHYYMSAPGIEYHHPNEGVDFRLVVPFYDFLRRYDFYTAGVKDWQFQGTDRYIREKESREELARCRNKDDLKAILYAKFGGEEALKRDKGMRSMIKKMTDTFSNIFDYEFTDNLFQNEDTTSAEWRLVTPTKEYTGHPLLVSAYAGLLPIVHTDKASRSPVFRNWVADIINKVYDWQRSLGKEGRKRLWVGLDEMQTVYEIGKSKDHAAEALENMFRQGGWLDVGFIVNTQNYDKVHEDIKDNASHLFCVNVKNPRERTQIQKRYNLDKEQTDLLASLKRFEIVAISNHPWVVYDSYGRRRVIEDRNYFKGTAIPPINTHL